MLVSGDEQLQKQIDADVAEIHKLMNYDGDDKIVPLTEIAAKLGDARAVNFPCLIPTLDNLLKGFALGELIIVSGPTKNGKTSFCRTLTENFAKQEIPTLWFSFEMPMRQFISTFKTIPACVFAPKQLKSSLVLWIESKIVEAILKFGVKIVFIDHLGFVSDDVQKRDRRIELDTIVRTIKTLCIKYDITIFLIHHITKIDPGTIPAYENLKETSAVAQDSDKVLMIYREFTTKPGKNIEYTGNTICSIEVDRREGCYKKKIKLKYTNNEFLELTNETEFGII